VVGFILGVILVPLIIFLICFIMKKRNGGYGALVGPESVTDYTAVSISLDQKNGKMTTYSRNLNDGSRPNQILIILLIYV